MTASWSRLFLFGLFCGLALPLLKAEHLSADLEAPSESLGSGVDTTGGMALKPVSKDECIPRVKALPWPRLTEALAHLEKVAGTADTKRVKIPPKVWRDQALRKDIKAQAAQKAFDTAERAAKNGKFECAGFVELAVSEFVKRNAPHYVKLYHTLHEAFNKVARSASIPDLLKAGVEPSDIPQLGSLQAFPANGSVNAKAWDTVEQFKPFQPLTAKLKLGFSGSRAESRLSPSNKSRFKALTPLLAELDAMAKPECHLCKAMFKNLAPPTTMPGEILRRVNSVDAVAKLSADMKNAVVSALMRDARAANLETAKLMSGTILTNGAIVETIKEFVKRFYDFMSWAENNLKTHVTKIGEKEDWWSFMFAPLSRAQKLDKNGLYVSNFDHTGRVDGKAAITAGLSWTGETGLIRSKQDFEEIMNKGNVREQLSLLYRTLWGGGHHQQGFFFLLERAIEKATTYAPDLTELKLDINAAVAFAQMQKQDNCIRDDNLLTSLSPPGGWGYVKYQCLASDSPSLTGPPDKLKIVHGFALPSPTKKKFQPFWDSRSMSPPLSLREIDWLYRSWGPDTQATRDKVQKAGWYIPWTGGGEILLNRNNMPDLPYSYPQWCESLLMRALGGPSKSTDLMMIPAKHFFGFTTKQLYHVRAALAAWMEQGQDHSFHEVLASAEAFGLPYVEFHQTNKNWHRVFDLLLAEPLPEGGKAHNHGRTELLGDYAAKHPDQVCSGSPPQLAPAAAIGAGHIKNRAAMLLSLQSTEPVPQLEAEPCPGLPMVNIPVDLLPKANIFSFGVFRVIESVEKHVYELLIAFSDNVAHFAVKKIGPLDLVTEMQKTHKSLVKFPQWSAVELRQKVSDASTGPDAFVKLDVQKSLLERTEVSIDASPTKAHCLSFTTNASPSRLLSLCTFNQTLYRDLAASAAYAKTLTTHDRTFQARQRHFLGVFSSQPFQKRTGDYEPPGIDHLPLYDWKDVYNWVCALKVPNDNSDATSIHIKFLRWCVNDCKAPIDVSLGENGRSSNNPAYSRAFCVSEAPRYMSTMDPVEAAPESKPAERAAYLREMAHRAAVCQYSFMETLSISYRPRDSVTNPIPYMVFREAFIDPGSKSWLPEYKHAVVFSGINVFNFRPINDIIADTETDTINLGYRSFSRDANVAYYYARQAKATKAPESHSGLLILIGTPGDRARQLKNSIHIRDHQAEVLLPPAQYKILHRRTYFSQDDTPEDVWERRMTKGLFVELYIQFVRWNEDPDPLVPP